MGRSLASEIGEQEGGVGVYVQKELKVEGFSSIIFGVSSKKKNLCVFPQ